MDRNELTEQCNYPKCPQTCTGIDMTARLQRVRADKVNLNISSEPTGERNSNNSMWEFGFTRCIKIPYSTEDVINHFNDADADTIVKCLLDAKMMLFVPYLTPVISG